MKIGNKEYQFQKVSRVLTVPDCNVLGMNKIGTGHGEAKFYFGSKSKLKSFTCKLPSINCFFLKNDLRTYIHAVQKEYMNPSQNYAGKDKMALLWNERVAAISRLPEIIDFTVDIQSQIAGPRGYINSKDNGYKLFRELSLPLISYISIMRLQSSQGTPVFYWKLFVDFDAMQQRGVTPLVFMYGKGLEKNDIEQKEKNEKVIVKGGGRDAAAQAKYRKKLLEECKFCPITKISDERLLIASHIKPFSVSEDNEAFDPKNGFMLSPLYDRLFDHGFISFDERKCMIVSNWLSPTNQARCQIKNGTFIKRLPLDNAREIYLKYHRKFVFKG
ncbi:MAG: HNH endonuclease signature motif containing protein [Evtepia sp.]